MANCGLFNGEGIDTSLLFFFLLLVIIFCNCYNQDSEHIKEEKKVAGDEPATFCVFRHDALFRHNFKFFAFGVDKGVKEEYSVFVFKNNKSFKMIVFGNKLFLRGIIMKAITKMMNELYYGYFKAYYYYVGYLFVSSKIQNALQDIS